MLSILEVSEGKLILHVYDKDILIVTDYAFTRRVVDPDSGNINKFQLVPFPGQLDKQFIILSGLKTINVLNLESGQMSVLVKSPTYAFLGA